MMRLNIKKHSKHLKIIPRINTSLMFDPKCSVCEKYLPVTVEPCKYFVNRNLEPVCVHCYHENQSLYPERILFLTSLHFPDSTRLVNTLIKGNYNYYWKHEALLLTVIGGNVTLHDLLNETKIVLFVGKFEIYNHSKSRPPPLESSLVDIYSWVKEVNEHENNNLSDP